MLTAKQFELFKSDNVIKDVEKAVTAIDKDLKAATSEQKKEMRSLSDMTNTSFYHAVRRGKASIKIILAMAQTLNANPYYYTGIADDRGEFTEETLSRFLTEYGYERLAQGKRQYNRQNKAKSSDSAKAAGSKSAVKPVKGKKSAKAKKSDKAEKAPVEQPVPVIEAAVSEETPVSVSKAEKVAVYDFDCSPKMIAKVKKLETESAVELLKALYIRSEAGENAEKLLEIVKFCLLA